VDLGWSGAVGVSTPQTSPAALTQLEQDTIFRGLFHDAAIFPPGDAPLSEAVPAHRAWRSSPWAPMVGPFICAASRWDELSSELSGDQSPLEVSLTVRGLRELVEVAPRALTEPRVRLVSIEVPASADDAAQIASVRDALPTPVLAYVELALPTLTPSAAEKLIEHGLRLKLRTGGLVPEAFPGERPLGDALLVASAAALPFKLTAGLHDPVRHSDAGTGFEHHGYLNILLAVARAVGGTSGDVVEALAEGEPRSIASSLASLQPAEVQAVRGLFDGFGTCSISDPIAGLINLGLAEDRVQ
jgi:hypothetical protein